MGVEHAVYRESGQFPQGLVKHEKSRKGACQEEKRAFRSFDNHGVQFPVSQLSLDARFIGLKRGT